MNDDNYDDIEGWLSRGGRPPLNPEFAGLSHRAIGALEQLKLKTKAEARQWAIENEEEKRSDFFGKTYTSTRNSFTSLYGIGDVTGEELYTWIGLKKPRAVVQYERFHIGAGGCMTLCGHEEEPERLTLDINQVFCVRCLRAEIGKLCLAIMINDPQSSQ